MEAGPRRTARHAEHVGDLLEGHPQVVVHDDDRAMLGAEERERAIEALIAPP